jgi:RimJ/RimL family protein N-acetyltransferase
MIFYKDHGYGTRVIKKLIEKFKQTADLIYCYVDNNNKGAIRFYNRLGKVDPKVNSKNEHLVVFYDNGKYKHG